MSRVSVIVPMFRARDTIAEALASLGRQGHPNLEVILVDDGSPDDTHYVAHQAMPSAMLVRQANGGPAKARNAGLAAATGDLIAFLDADDIWPDDKLSLQLPYLAEGSGFDMALGTMRKFRRASEEADYTFSEPAFLFVLGCGLYRRGVFDRIGNFDHTMPFGYSDDTDWMLRAWEAKVPIKFQTDVTLHYRRHQSSITAGMDSTTNGFLLAVKMSLERRRRANGAVPTAMPHIDIPADMPGNRLGAREG